jgi:pimeloyl-ACP methyl ester carboxylesterase
MPALIISGDRDQISPVAALRALEAPGRTIVIAPGVDHSWWPGLDVLSEALRSFIETNVIAARA